MGSTEEIDRSTSLAESRQYLVALVSDGRLDSKTLRSLADMEAGLGSC